MCVSGGEESEISVSGHSPGDSPGADGNSKYWLTDWAQLCNDYAFEKNINSSVDGEMANIKINPKVR